MMQKIDMRHYMRKAQFNAFKDREIPYFATTSNVDITNMKKILDNNNLGFFISVSFIICKAINSIPELRHRIIGDELFEFNRVDPAYTVLLDDDTFSFCDGRYFDDFTEYLKYAKEAIGKAKTCPDLDNKEKQHMFFITNIPWFTFTSFVHPYYQKYGSIPIITVGKYAIQSDKLILPIAIQVHHGVVDGVHVGKFYSSVSYMCMNPSEWLK